MTDPIIADEGGEVGCLEAVDGVEELGAVVGIHSCETAPREQAQLQQGGDGGMLACLCGTTSHESKLWRDNTGSNQALIQALSACFCNA